MDDTKTGPAPRDNAEKADDAATKRIWVEPDVRKLAVSETAMLPARGGDGSYGGYADCTRS